MTSRKFIQSKLEARTNAQGSWHETKNNRFHYNLVFDESIGWDWIEQQVEQKVAGETDTELEMWELHPHDAGQWCVEVREVARREGIDDSQQGLDEF